MTSAPKIKPTKPHESLKTTEPSESDELPSKESPEPSNHIETQNSSEPSNNNELLNNETITGSETNEPMKPNPSANLYHVEVQKPLLYSKLIDARLLWAQENESWSTATSLNVTFSDEESFVVLPTKHYVYGWRKERVLLSRVRDL